MPKSTIAVLVTVTVLGIAAITTLAQSPATADTVEAHKAAAKLAAGADFMGVYDAACPADTPQPARGPGGPGAGRGPRPDPPREQWYAEPVKVFDNLYYIGTKVHGAWAVTTPEGIIVIEALFGYAAGPEIAEGLKKVGLDPANIKYVIVSHGHGDHSGGMKYLQDTYNPHIILSEADWDLLDKDTRNPKARRDMIATDGQKLTLGGESLTLYLTPGHTAGTLSTVIPVMDGKQKHVAVEWGGTVISTSTSIPMLESYIRNAARLKDIAGGSGADVIITNHTAFDNTLTKLEALGNRKAGEPNPYLVGKAGVQRYLTVAEECGKATLVAAKAMQAQKP